MPGFENFMPGKCVVELKAGCTKYGPPQIATVGDKVLKGQFFNRLTPLDQTFSDVRGFSFTWLRPSDIISGLQRG
jgi:hypothetical protein